MLDWSPLHPIRTRFLKGYALMPDLDEIHAKVIPHSDQRYDTTGDYFTKDGIEEFRISRLSDERHEHLILVHELIERILCHHRGISNEAIDRFDFDYVKSGKLGEPGDDPQAPYHAEHRFATKIEKLLAQELEVEWNRYLDDEP